MLLKRKKKIITEEKNLIEQINTIEQLTFNLSPPNILLDILDEHKNKLETLCKEKLNGLIIRSRARWIEYGEKSSQYFCTLEKRNYINKNIKKIIDNNGTVITNLKCILEKISDFYKNLYRSRDDVIEDVNLSTLIDRNIYKLRDSEAEHLEGKITDDELLKALKHMKNDKSPGTDGLTVEFYKFFWKDIGTFLRRSLNYSFDKGELSVTQKQGIVSIIPKARKPREFLKNWRPITLLNISYKLLSSCLANRIKTVLDTLMHENQKGFLKGRYIGENIRLLYDILEFTEQSNIPGLLLLIDFEKAFDSVSWKFLHNVLYFFNFGPEFREWIEIILSDSKLCVIQNGIFSQFFNIGRGCR